MDSKNAIVLDHSPSLLRNSISSVPWLVEGFDEPAKRTGSSCDYKKGLHLRRKDGARLPSSTFRRPSCPRSYRLILIRISSITWDNDNPTGNQHSSDTPGSVSVGPYGRSPVKCSLQTSRRTENSQPIGRRISDRRRLLQSSASLDDHPCRRGVDSAPYLQKAAAHQQHHQPHPCFDPASSPLRSPRLRCPRSSIRPTTSKY